MNTAQIAATLIERRKRPNPVVFQGEILSAIGSDGLSEALARRWLVPNHDTGYLQFSPDEGVMLEMRQMAVTEADKKKRETDDDDDSTSDVEKAEKKRAKGEHDRARADFYDDGDEEDEKVEESAARMIIAGHANRDRLSEDIYGMAGSSSPASSAPAAPAPAATGSPRTHRSEPRDIGHSVTVVENGKTYQGKVAAKTEDGKYRVSFGGERPPQERAYSEEELGDLEP